MSAEILLSGFDKTTQELAFRIYCTEVPEAERRQMHKAEHFAALDLLGAALCRDFGIRHAKICRTGLDKPRLVHDSLHMNLSHCKGLAVCAVSRVPVGIDAETPRQVRDSLLPRICTPAETDWISSQDDKNLAFSRIWTLKEAYAKYTGAGIREPFSQLAFSLTDGIRFHHPDAENVRFFQLIRENHQVVTICLKNGVWGLIPQRGLGQSPNFNDREAIPYIPR